MKTLTVMEAEYGFGRLIDISRSEPVAKHGPQLIVGLTGEDFERPKARGVIDSCDTGGC
jgi:hypothetical protein